MSTDPLIPSSSQPPSFAPRPVEPPSTVLFGPFGLRAGWGILIFVLLMVLFVRLLYEGEAAATGQLKQMHAEQTAERTAHGAPQPMRLVPVAINETAQAFGLLAAAALVALLERRRFGVFGLVWQRLKDLAPGALAGLLAMSALVGVLRLTHALSFDARLLSGAAIAGYGAAWLAVFFFVGLGEEFLFRGYIQFTLTRGLFGLGRKISPNNPRTASFWIVAILLSTAFFAAHLANSGETPAGLAGVFLAGILFSYALWRTGSLWWGIGFHMTWDWAQSFLFGVPDSGTLSVGRLFQTHAAGATWLSGGVDGPEGSVLMIPIVFAVVALLRLTPQRPQPELEPISSPKPSIVVPGYPGQTSTIP